MRLTFVLFGIVVCVFSTRLRFENVCTAAELTDDDVLSIRHERFFLEGKPFAEISFNKFDLFWQLYDQLDGGKSLDDANPLLRSQEKALRNLHELGFRSIRIFALPWGPAGKTAYTDPEKRKRLYAALDKTLDLCDKYNIRVVWSLGAANFTDSRLVPGQGWVHGTEQLRELVADPRSQNRQLFNRYIDDIVTRYKNRRAVLMWEITNELTLQADIGDKDGVYDGQRMPTLKDVADFSSDAAKRIKAADPLRLVNNGGSIMREHQWHLYKRQGWVFDTLEEQYQCFNLVFSNSAVDVIDIHSYLNGKPGYVIRGADGKESLLRHQDYVGFAARLHKPLMIGELGLQAAAKTDRKIGDAAPDYFESYDDIAAAKPWIDRTLNDVVDAGVQLAYWWCYQSDRSVDRGDRQHFDIDQERHPELIACFVAANKRLQANRARDRIRTGISSGN